MPFGVNNALVFFSRIVIKEFQEYLYKTMEICFNDWTVYNLLKEYVKWLHLMLEYYKQIQLELNIKKCISTTPIGILLWHVVCKEGIKIDLAKIKVIPYLKPPINPKQVRSFLGPIEYYREFIIHYSNITFSYGWDSQRKCSILYGVNNVWNHLKNSK